MPGGPSIACSTARAIEWDESFKNRADCSGRSVAGVHQDAYNQEFVIPANAAANNVKANGEELASPAKKAKK